MNWHAVTDAFEKARSLPQNERAGFLRQHCAGDQEFQREVESLLKAYEASAEFLEESAVAQVGDELDPLPEGMIGARLGAFRITRLIGEGGMGEVYEAERADGQFRQRAAIKIVREDWPDRRRHDRLRAERQILSDLNHPHIARLLDGGATETGAPYLVMELIDGEPIDSYCDSRGLRIAQRLELFGNVCDAVEHANRQKVIHCDLKPGNILVTADGAPKLLDFGISRLLSAGPQTTQTCLATPEYASPEQLTGGPITPATDVYALGVILRKLAGGEPALSAVIARATRVQPSERYPSAAALGDAARRSGVEWWSRWRILAAGHAAVVGTGGKLGRMVISVLTAAVLAAGGLYYWAHRNKPLTDKDSIILSDFTNTTGDSLFDDTLKQGLSVQLEQSPFLDLVSERKVNETLKLMGRHAGERLTPEVTLEVCQRTGSKAMLTGSIAALGSQYVIGLKAVNCSTGDVLTEAQEQAAGKEGVLKALGAAAVRLRSKLGESLNSVQKYSTPVEEATTSSLEALKAYSLGLKTVYAKGGTPALPFFQRAVGLDPDFAMAYCWMSAEYRARNEAGKGLEYARKAYELRTKVSERERLQIEAGYCFTATGQMERAAQIYGLWQQTYPRDRATYTMTGFVSAVLGNWQKALEGFQEALRREPNLAANYENLAIAYAALNRLDEAEAVYKQEEERKLESAFLLQNRYFLAFLKGDTARMAQVASAAMGKPGEEDLLLATQADTEGWYGRLKNAHELTGRAMDSARHNDANESAAAYQATAALREAESGNRGRARAEAHAALKLGPNRDVRSMAALALARAGDGAGAEKLAAALDHDFPLDTQAQRYWLPTIRAAIALERKDPIRAIELLKVASSIELSDLTTNLAIFMSPVYVRGEACLMLRDGNRAAAEFQKFIDHRGLVANFPWAALARLGLARAYALQGDTAKARAAYEDFLTLWKDADPDIPILKEAKAEYAKLQSQARSQRRSSAQ